MQQFLAFVTKEFRHIFRDPLTTAIMVVLPVVMLLLFGFAISTEVKNTRFAVYASKEDVATRAIVERLAANDYFILARILSDPKEIHEVFARGEVGLAVVFSSNFYEELLHTGDAQVQLIADGTDPNTAKTLVSYAQNIIAAYQLELMREASVPLLISPEVKLLYNPSMKGAYNFVPGVMGMILLLICAMMTSVSIAREKESGTMEVLLVSPIRPLQMIFAKTVPYFVISMVDLAIILLIAVYVIDVPVVGSLTLLVGTALVYIFLALAMGIVISTIAKTQTAALLISGMAMMMPVVMLSGMMFPIDSMPWPLQLISNIVPAKWFIRAVSKIMIRGLGFEAVRTELAILTGMAMLMIAVGVKKHQVRLE